MSLKYLLTAALVALAAAPLSAQTVKAGIEAWQRADYGRAVAIWSPLAENGDPDAQFNLGQAYRLGRGVPTNLAMAKDWFERAALRGHVDALTTLGLLLFQNGEQTAGLKWLSQAAEKGEPRAMLVYGTALFNGDGVTQNPVLGYAYVSRAAAQGLAPAKTTLAELDQILPLEQRQEGVALARRKAAAAKPGPPAAAVAAAKAAAKALPKAAAKALPKTTLTAPAPAPTAASGAWRVQLGAFSRRESAEALFKKLSGSSALAGRRPFYVAVGAVIRLQAGPFENRAAAAAACAALSAKGQACFPVAAR